MKGISLIDAAFIRIPRLILELSFSRSPKTRELYRLFTAIYCLCYHSQGIKAFNKTTMLCHPGQLLTSIRELSETTGISIWRVQRLLEKLKEKELITVDVIGKVHLITVVDYQKISKTRVGKSLHHTNKPSAEHYDETPTLTGEQRREQEEMMNFLKKKEEQRKTIF